jgi:hypothetical protein
MIANAPSPRGLDRPAGFAPSFRTVETVEAEMVVLLSTGRSFGALCSDLVERLGEERGLERAGAFLGQWLADGVIVSVNASVDPPQA